MDSTPAPPTSFAPRSSRPPRRSAFALRVWPAGPRSAASAAALFAMGALVGFLVVPARPRSARDLRQVVRLGGHTVPVDGDAAQIAGAVREGARAYLRERVTIAVPGSTAEPRAWSREALGARLAPERASALARELGDPTSPLLRAHAATMGGRAPLDVPPPVRIDDARALAAILELKDDVDVPATRARIDFAARAPVPERGGTRLDAYGTLARLDAAVASGEPQIHAVTEAMTAAPTLAQIEGIAYDVELGAFSTKLDEAALDDGRRAELQRQAAIVDGAVVLAGETFDFVDAVGAPGRGASAGTPTSPSEKAHGRGGGGGRRGGGVEAGAARGVSLLAGALHAAAFFAGMEIVERHPLKRPSTFVPMGLEARVAYPGVTLRIKNPFPYAVVFRAVAGGAPANELRAAVLGPERTREVTFVRKVNEALPFPEREIEDPKIPRGVRVLAQRGVPGFAITRYRIVREGTASVQERLDDRYPPSAQIWRKGTGEPNRAFKPRPDSRPEYLADASLTLRAPPPGAPDASPRALARVAGASGTPGLAARLAHGVARVISEEGAGAGAD